MPKVVLIQNVTNGRFVKAIERPREGLRCITTTADNALALRPSVDQIEDLCDLDPMGIPYPPLGRHRSEYKVVDIEVAG